jgi:hypothetical protein
LSGATDLEGAFKFSYSVCLRLTPSAICQCQKRSVLFRSVGQFYEFLSGPFNLETWRIASAHSRLAYSISINIHSPAVMRTHITAIEWGTCGYVAVFDCPIFHSQRGNALCYNKKMHNHEKYVYARKVLRSSIGYLHGSTASLRLAWSRSRIVKRSLWSLFILVHLTRTTLVSKTFLKASYLE